MSKTEKKKKGTIIVATLIVVVVLIVVTVGLLIYFDKIKLSSSSEKEQQQETNGDNSLGNGFTEEDLKNPYEVTPPDADKYFNENTSVKSEVKAPESNDVRSESEVYRDFAERGFSNPITTEYDMDGKYYEEIQISRYSSTIHPIYQTYYITSNEEVWMIFEINGAIMANPLTYNAQKESGVQLMLSESNTITSYDSTKNKFYINIPNADVLSVKKVDRIDAETLENLTHRELDRL